MKEYWLCFIFFKQKQGQNKKYVKEKHGIFTPNAPTQASH